jgi:hypothetical protein
MTLGISTEVMTEHVFTAAGAWTGGSFELLLYLEHATEERVRRVVKSIWTAPRVLGCWLELDLEPAEQERVFPGDLDLGVVLRGLATLPNDSLAACASSLVNDEGGWWLYFGIPMGSLGRAYPVGAYPFESGAPTDWIVPVSEWLLGVATSVFGVVPFEAGVIGWLTTADVDTCRDIASGRVPSDRWHGCLIPNEGVLEWYRPNRSP